jgi:hypothetical protein
MQKKSSDPFPITLHHQPEFGRVAGDVRLQNSDQIAEHSAVRTDRNPRAGAYTSLISAQTFSENSTRSLLPYPAIGREPFVNWGDFAGNAGSRKCMGSPAPMLRRTFER